MELVVVSDNHGRAEPLAMIRERYPHAQAYIHCGDSELPPEQLAGFAAVMGNNDYFFDYPKALILNVGDIRILVTHGHRQSSFDRIGLLTAMAHKHDCKIVCYGHTHVFDQRINDGVLLVNPGSLWRNRDGSEPCFAIIRTDEQGNFTVERKTL